MNLKKAILLRDAGLKFNVSACITGHMLNKDHALVMIDQVQKIFEDADNDLRRQLEIILGAKEAEDIMEALEKTEL